MEVTFSMTEKILSKLLTKKPLSFSNLSEAIENIHLVVNHFHTLTIFTFLKLKAGK